MDLTMKAWDAINGALGECYSVIDGNMESMLYLRNINADVEKNKKEIRVLGFNGTKNKSTGWKGTGTANLYFVTSLFRKMFIEYMHTGKDFYFDMYIVNDDPGSEAGRQKIWLKNVNIDKITLGKLDIENTELNEDITFTFEDAEIIEEFDEITGE